MKFGMAIDITRCMGCHTCAVACKMANNLPNDVWWNKIRTENSENKDVETGTYPYDLKRRYFPVACQQCNSPACVAVCPTGASAVREEDGVVLIDAEKCIGCGSCIEACPYDVRTLYADTLLYSVDFAVGDEDAPEHKSGTVGKCTGCYNRRDRGLAPACMVLCPARARHWGDLDDPNSDISQFIAGKTVEKLQEAAGTDPQCYYVS